MRLAGMLPFQWQSWMDRPTHLADNMGVRGGSIWAAVLGTRLHAGKNHVFQNLGEGLGIIRSMANPPGDRAEGNMQPKQRPLQTIRRHALGASRRRGARSASRRMRPESAARGGRCAHALGPCRPPGKIAAQDSARPATVHQIAGEIGRRLQRELCASAGVVGVLTTTQVVPRE